ncbi:mannose-1-phosphate guanylyltransferase/mannose-6-phosphate isomerase [Alphaproteobacteria bacterium]|nr:mannose-1-phosphate guanylyltransferase/mannose-6-phosphate isomerase [Alphaproteobacteria bacterium]
MSIINPVILCGGVGSRLWPLSRNSLPKQFAPIIGDQSLFHQAVSRTDRDGFADPVIITSDDHRFLAQKQLHELDIDGSIILEPKGKNTAPAIFVAALHASRGKADALVLVMPSDHHIPDNDAFAQMVATGAIAAQEGAIVTFGVTPDRPETGYGYIETDMAHENPCHLVTGFHEKPDLVKAEAMLAAGNYLWNAGIFLFRADVMLELAKKLQPAMLASVRASHDAAIEDHNFWHLGADAWNVIEPDSIDYAIMEKAKHIVCVAFQGRWSDLGDWRAVVNEFDPDANGNLTVGDSSVLDCENSVLWSNAEGTHLVGLGLENIIAVATDDAVMIAHADKSQDVRKIVTHLEDKGVSQATQHIKDYRPWGWFESLANMQGYQVKRLHVYPGAALSLQSHEHRSEHWVVVDGIATIQIEDDIKDVATNESVYIHVGQKHRLANDTDAPLTVIEVQTGSYLGEDDIIRYEDVYNR